jgi:GST-like protein
MTYVLYGEDGSGSGIVEMALVAIGAPHEVRHVSLGTDQQRATGYANVNPQRKLPTLITPAGETLTESAAILLVLDERHPDARLLPAPGTSERAQALRWLLFAATELYPIVEINDYPARFAPSPESAPAVREVARRIWRERWLIVEHAVQGSPWLSPAGFSFVDVYLATLSRWAQQDEWRPEHLPKIERIAAAVSEREPIAPIWRRHRGR